MYEEAYQILDDLPHPLLDHFDESSLLLSKATIDVFVKFTRPTHLWAGMEEHK